jgi:membrane protein YdbS with pleckstrin-like domain
MKMHSVREFLTLVLMAGFFFVLFYVNVGFLYKIFMAVLVFAMVFLLGLADETIKRVEDRKF